MASSGTLAAGTTSYGSTITTGGTAETVTFTDRYGYITVTNLGTTAIYVRTDGTAAGVSASSSYVVGPGASVLFANAQPIWYQSSRVLPKGVHQVGGGNTATSATSPGTVTPMESLAGQMANPGTVVSVICATAGGAYSVEAAG